MAIVDSSGKFDSISVHYPNDNLVSAIIRAWTDPKFRSDLLSYPDLTTRDAWLAEGRPSPNYGKTSELLEEMGVFVERPVVLTPAQYEWGYTKTGCDVVYVLPDQPSTAAASYSVNRARTAMQFCIFGM
ncbi:MAG TPA: hypothetical protein VMI72_08760 [Roseiarcus sp.]|nr:hypothetical protein [Roseiarcus sp.]